MVGRFRFVVAVLVASANLAGCGPRPDDPRPIERSSALTGDPHDVWTQHNDNARTGATLVETRLTTANVNGATFGKLFTRAVDDQIYAQPLYLTGVPIAGGVRNVVYVATVAGTVFAFDAERAATAQPLARRNLLDVAAAGARPPSHVELGQACGGIYMNFTGNIGIVGTPVVDRASNTMYLVSRAVEGENFVQRLHALDITTLADKMPPAVITAEVAGEGDATVDGKIPFDPKTTNQRAALLLLKGSIYIAWASYCDTNPFHGWFMGYDAATLKQNLVWNVTPDGGQGGIWQSGEGPTSDGTSIYLVTGNGTSNVQQGGRSYGSTIVRLDPTNPAAPVADWFLPFNFQYLNDSDNDLGTSGALLIPDTNFLVGGSKEGVIYLLDRTNLGHLHDGDNSQIVQSIEDAGNGHIHGSAVTWTGAGSGTSVYFWAENDRLKQLPLVGGKLDKTNMVTSMVEAPKGMPGAMLSISANGNTDGTAIVWASHPANGDAEDMTQTGILRALDAHDVSKELWNSLDNRVRDDGGNFAKFVPPTVANGRVYLATFSNQLVVYGLLADAAGPTSPPPAVADGGSVTAPADAAPTTPTTPTTPGSDAAPGRDGPDAAGAGAVTPAPESGCSCQLGARETGATPWLIPLLLAGGLLRRRRRST